MCILGVVPIVGVCILRVRAEPAPAKPTLTTNADLLDQLLDLPRLWARVEEPEVAVRSAVVHPVQADDVKTQVQSRR